MGIKEIVLNNVKSFEVTVNQRSQITPSIRAQRKRRGISTLKEAMAIEKELIRECATEVAKLEGTGLPWPDLLEKYELVHRSGSPLVKSIQLSTIWENIATLRRFTKGWENKFCNDINAGDVRRVLQDMLDQGYSKSRLKTVRGAINTVFKWGIEDGTIRGIRNSPAADIHLGRVNDEKPPQVLSLNEIQRLLDEARDMDHEWYPVWFMALHTGMRSGELYALEWNDIDFETKMITVSKSYNHKMKRVKSTKAGYWRKVPMSQETEAILIELRAKRSFEHDNVLPRIGMWKRGEAAKILREFCTQIGVNSVNFHALRACFATHLLNAGVSSPVVKKICGWTDEKVMTRYIRLAGIDVRGATENLGFVRPNVPIERKVASLNDFRLVRKVEQTKE